MKTRTILFFHIIFSLLFILKLSAQSTHHEITWKDAVYEHFNEDSTLVLRFNGAVHTQESGTLPAFMISIPLSGENIQPVASISKAVFSPLDHPLEAMDMTIGTKINIVSRISTGRGKSFAVITFVPLRKKEGFPIEKLESFDLDISWKSRENHNTRIHEYTESSALSQGEWHKFKVYESGIYKLSYEDLLESGIDLSDAKPSEFGIFGNGGRMLSESNYEDSDDDLIENAIYIYGEDDGSFDPGDYILFYAEGPVTWSYNPFRIKFEHSRHLYSDYSGYFFTTSQGSGLRIGLLSPTSVAATDTIDTYIDYGCHETENVNLIKSGKLWFGEEFNEQAPSLSFPFSFSQLADETQPYYRLELAARSSQTSYFEIRYQDEVINDFSVTGISSSTVYARKVTNSGYINVDDDDFAISIDFLPQQSSSFAWLNYIEVNLRRKLIFEGEQKAFRDNTILGNGRVTEYVISNQSSEPFIWDVSDIHQAKRVLADMQNPEIRFRLPSEELRELIIFSPSNLSSPEYSGEISNQNLHAPSYYDYIIISHPDFLNQAEELAELHRQEDMLEVLVVTPEEIYNEFSSGMQDISGIRNFLRMHYERGSSEKRLKYVLLYGDGSYDPLDREPENTNFIPTFQSKESLVTTASFVSDDFYGLFDSDEGNDALGTIDIGIGRLPVKNETESINALNKIKHYYSNGEVYKPWRTNICFIADDEDGNLHLDQAEELVLHVDTTYHEYNIDKIYLDAYQQTTTPSGKRYPEVNDRINERVEEGALIINYTGHGGETGWSDEKVLNTTDILLWENFDHMPLFLTATCEFSRYDDPWRTAAGELVFLNPDGGGIALITTTRLAFAQSNFSLNQKFYNHVFEKVNNVHYRLGDIIMLSKIPAIDNNRNIHLLGDPAITLAYPDHKIETLSFTNNSQDINDTISARDEARITGNIISNDSQALTNFNGIIYITIYDKADNYYTLGNDPRSYPSPFKLQKSVLHQGIANIENGSFSYTFMLPRDLDYQYGNGKISYYATDGSEDAQGIFEDFIIGGLSENNDHDYEGPEISLYINDPQFEQGTTIGQDARLFAKLYDESGINIYNTSLGHDITAIIDDKSAETIVLNDIFIPDTGSYKSGSIELPIVGLEEGRHILRLKAWDLNNNSSTAEIEFVVSASYDLSIDQLLAAPNPFSEKTNISFRHNQYNEELEIMINIFSINGSLVKQIGPLLLSSTAYMAGGIEWDGNDQNGSPMDTGMYIYKIFINNQKGSELEYSGKLLLVR